MTTQDGARAIAQTNTVIPHKKILWAVFILDAVVVGIALLLNDPKRFFTEIGFVTYFSFFQLLTVFALSREIFILRRGKTDVSVWQRPYAIWLIMAAAFVFMSLDEILTIHEHIDTFIHYIFSMQETWLTDRIDDILVGLYGLAGVLSFRIYREEFKRYQKALPLFVAGFIVLFIMVGIDILTNRNDFFKLFVSDPTIVHALDYWADIIEDIIKIIAEGIFIGAFYRCYEITRRT